MNFAKVLWKMAKDNRVLMNACLIWELEIRTSLLNADLHLAESKHSQSLFLKPSHCTFVLRLALCWLLLSNLHF